MKIKHFIFFFIAIQFFSLALSAQVKSTFCRNLQTIISAVENGTLSNLKGAPSTYNPKNYSSTISLNNSGGIYQDDDIGMNFSECVSFSDDEFNSYLEALTTCLPTSDWIISDESDKRKIIKIFKNLKSRVFIRIKSSSVTITVYQQKKTSAKCLWGNCTNGYGSYKYENEDVYTGDFINGFKTGNGVYQWSASGEYYDGGWLNGKMNGEGAMYKSDSSLIRKGLLYQNTWLNVDLKTTKNFTKDETVNGFGMVYNNGAYQICTHKDSKPSGISLVKNTNTVYGDYQNTGFNGFCIVYYPNGESFYGKFENGSVKGNGTKYLTDGTHLEGYFEPKIANVSKFNVDGFLLQKESWVDGKLTVDNSANATMLVKFSKAMSDIFLTGPKKLKGKKISDDIIMSNESKIGVPGALKTVIQVDMKLSNYFLKAEMSSSGSNKSKALTEYNALIQKVKNSISSGWVGTEIESKDTDTNLFRIYKFTNSLYNYTYEVKCWFNDVSLEFRWLASDVSSFW